jgi:phage-related protein
MARKVAYAGNKFLIAFARDKDGGSPALDFFERLNLVDQAKLMNLFRIAGDRAAFHNPEKFGNLGGGLFEFKSFQIRMPFAYAASQPGLIPITHGFIKKKQKTPRAEIERAWRIYHEDQKI